MLSSTEEEMDYMEEKQNIDSITETLLLYMYFLYQKHEIPYLHFAIKRAVTIFMARFECLKYVYSGSCSWQHEVSMFSSKQTLRLVHDVNISQNNLSMITSLNIE